MSLQIYSSLLQGHAGMHGELEKVLLLKKLPWVPYWIGNVVVVTLTRNFVKLKTVRRVLRGHSKSISTTTTSFQWIFKILAEILASIILRGRQNELVINTSLRISYQNGFWISFDSRFFLYSVYVRLIAFIKYSQYVQCSLKKVMGLFIQASFDLLLHSRPYLSCLSSTLFKFSLWCTVLSVIVRWILTASKLSQYSSSWKCFI